MESTVISFCSLNLAVPYLQDALIPEALQSQHAVRATAYAGTRLHYHSSSCGKALLAEFPEEQRRWLYANVGLQRMTENTICDVDAFEAQLEDIRRTDIAYDRQENEIGGYCIAMAIFGPFNEAVGSISVSGVIERMVPSFVEEISEMLRSATTWIGIALGNMRG